MTPRELTRDEFHSCFVEPMQDVTYEPVMGIGIWPYVEAVQMPPSGPTKALDVAYVYRDAHNRYDQVLIETNKFNVLLVVVVDVKKADVFGHRFLDLNEEYGLPHSS